MGRYFGREPRYSREEAEAQAKQAIEAAMNKGRPPDNEWKGLASRMGDLNRELATRPPVDIPPPPSRRAEQGEAPARRRPVNEILRPRPAPAPVPAPEAAAPAPTPAKRTTRKTAPAAAPAAAPAKRTTKRTAKAAAAEPAPPAKRARKSPAPARAAAPAKRATKKRPG
ncbi:MAG TPA: hypothetical protein VHF91_08145 [Acidimicrobiales bacterium]|nr:hypothetical protein [Acidimicrobiales bacterium]